MPTKRCPRCTKSKPLDASTIARDTLTGRSTDFRFCGNQLKRAWAPANPEKVSVSQKAWRMKQRARHLEEGP